MGFSVLIILWLNCETYWINFTLCLVFKKIMYSFDWFNHMHIIITNVLCVLFITFYITSQSVSKQVRAGEIWLKAQGAPAKVSGSRLGVSGTSPTATLWSPLGYGSHRHMLRQRISRYLFAEWVWCKGGSAPTSRTSYSTHPARVR